MVSLQFSSIIDLITIYIIFKFVFFTANIIYQYILPLFGFSCDLRRYGKWAVITGASDGIGKQYAIQLAEKHLSVVLISFAPKELNEVAEYIRSKYKVGVKTIEYDFANTDDYDVLRKELDKLDIGILVNNVGGMSYSKIPGHTNSNINEIFNVIYVNVYSNVGMTSMILPKMIKQQRGLIIHISSFASECVAPSLSVYAGAKVFIRKFAGCLKSIPFVDQQVVLPSYVATKGSGTPVSFSSPSPEIFVRYALRTAGRCSLTYGYWVHDITGAMASYIPEFIMPWLINNLRDSAEPRR